MDGRVSLEWLFQQKHTYDMSPVASKTVLRHAENFVKQRQEESQSGAVSAAADPSASSSGAAELGCGHGRRRQWGETAAVGGGGGSWAEAPPWRRNAPLGQVNRSDPTAITVFRAALTRRRRLRDTDIRY
jgi:hypothetical protein